MMGIAFLLSLKVIPMCGIVGAASHQDIVSILVQGLQRLEYRGYDSCGVAVHNDSLAGHGQGLRRARSTARVSELLARKPSRLTSGGRDSDAGSVLGFVRPLQTSSSPQT